MSEHINEDAFISSIFEMASRAGFVVPVSRSEWRRMKRMLGAKADTRLITRSCPHRQQRTGLLIHGRDGPFLLITEWQAKRQNHNQGHLNG